MVVVGVLVKKEIVMRRVGRDLNARERVSSRCVRRVRFGGSFVMSSSEGGRGRGLEVATLRRWLVDHGVWRLVTIEQDRMVAM